MPVTGELQLDLTSYRHIVLAAGAGARATIRVLGVVALASAVSSLGAGFGGVGVVLPILVGLALIAAPDLVVLWSWRRVRGLADRPWRYEITTDGVGVHTPQTSVTVGWDAISRARIRRRAWLYTVAATRRSLVVPRAAFTPAEQAVVDRYVREGRFRTSASA